MILKHLGTSCAGLLLLAAFLGAQPTFAASSPAAERFDQLDTNKDGKLVLEEFRAAFPSLTEQAFVVIDKNGDGAVERAEWVEFTEGHGRGMQPAPDRGAPMNNIPGDPIIPPLDSADLPLMRPPGM